MVKGRFETSTNGDLIRCASPGFAGRRKCDSSFALQERGERPCCPVAGNHKALLDKDLTITNSTVDRKRDSEKSKTVPNQAEIDTSELPSDLVEVVAVWPELPEHIKAAIGALIKTNERK